MDGAFERVHTPRDWYDGPRTGIADFGGVPHFYNVPFSEELDEYEDELCELSPLDAATFQLALEECAIWRRFSAAKRAGDVSDEWAIAHWGVLPPDLQRYEELQPNLAAALLIDPERRIVGRASFRAIPSMVDATPDGDMRPLEVCWRAIE